MREEKESRPREEEDSSGRFWQRLAATVGIVIVGGCVGFLGWQGLTADDSPPDLRLQIVEIVPQQSGYLVRVQTANAGGTTAARVRVEGRLTDDRNAIERSEAVLDYVPSQSRREAALVFRHDPRGSQVALRVLGFEAP